MNCPESLFLSCFWDLGGGWVRVGCRLEQLQIVYGHHILFPGAPGDILCLHRLLWDTISLKDSVLPDRAFQVFILILTNAYFNFLDRAGFWYRRRCLLTKPYLFFVQKYACHRSANLSQHPHIGILLLWVYVTPLNAPTTEVMKRKLCDWMILASPSTCCEIPDKFLYLVFPFAYMQEVGADSYVLCQLGIQAL